MAVMKMIKDDTPPLVDRVLPWSSYQHEIFREISEGGDNLLINAVAGSGKTTTIVHALTMLPPGSRALFMAFNKSVEQQLVQVCPPEVTVKTLHAMGMMIIRNNRSKLKVHGGKVRDMLRNEVLNINKVPANKDWYYENSANILRFISLLKAGMVQDVSEAAVKSYIDGGDIDLPTDYNSLCIYTELLSMAYTYDGEDDIKIDFDDMVCLPSMLENITFPKYDYVFVDEAQDMNFAQREMVAHLIDEGGRLIAVGDTHQAIYGFRGADHDSMDRFRDNFACKELELPICYRCDSSIIAQAKVFQPHIEARPLAKPGSVKTVRGCRINDHAKLGDMILCRTNAPLMKTAIQLLGAGSNVCLLGKDLMPAFMKILKGVEGAAGVISASRIRDYLVLQQIALQDRPGQLMKMEDNCLALQYVVGDKMVPLEQMVDGLEKVIFSEAPKTPHIMLSTIHKAKGSESDRVFIVAPEQLPHKCAKSEAQLQQEDNLHYVAITRAKHELFYVTTEK